MKTARPKFLSFVQFLSQSHDKYVGVCTDLNIAFSFNNRGDPHVFFKSSIDNAPTANLRQPCLLVQTFTNQRFKEGVYADALLRLLFCHL